MHWYWVPIVGPILGAILGAIVYIGLIEVHYPPEEVPLGETYGRLMRQDVHACVRHRCEYTSGLK